MAFCYLPLFEQRNRLIAAGVPNRHLEARLNSFTEGQVVEKWLSNGGFRNLRQGGCCLFETRNLAAVETLPILTSEFMRRNINAVFLSIDKLARMVEERDYKQFDKTRLLEMLVIGDFFEASKGPRTCPFSVTQRRRIEDLLLDRKDRKRGTILQVHNPYHLALNYLDWWRHSVFDRLKPEVLRIPLLS